MKLTTEMCHTHLMSILLQPELCQRAFTRYNSTTPDVDCEGMRGYISVTVEFEIKDLEEFSKLFESSYVYPTNRSRWYHMIRSGILKCEEK